MKQVVSMNGIEFWMDDVIEIGGISSTNNYEIFLKSGKNWYFSLGTMWNR